MKSKTRPFKDRMAWIDTRAQNPDEAHWDWSKYFYEPSGELEQAIDDFDDDDRDAVREKAAAAIRKEYPGCTVEFAAAHEWHTPQDLVEGGLAEDVGSEWELPPKWGYFEPDYDVWCDAMQSAIMARIEENNNKSKS